MTALIVTVRDHCIQTVGRKGKGGIRAFEQENVVENPACSADVRIAVLNWSGGRNARFIKQLADIYLKKKVPRAAGRIILLPYAVLISAADLPDAMLGS
jgi:hypothetical protein